MISHLPQPSASHEAKLQKRPPGHAPSAAQLVPQYCALMLAQICSRSPTWNS